MSPQEFDPEAEYHYPARDFLCLSCVVPGGCKPYAALCLWRADQSEDPLRRREVQLLLAIRELVARRRMATVRTVASWIGVSPTAAAVRIEAAVDAGLLARGCAQHDYRGVSLTAAGRQRLTAVENRRPQLRLNGAQRGYYQLLATLRDLQAVGQVSATLLASALRRSRASVMVSLVTLEGLALVHYDRGWVELTDTGRHLLETLRAYAVNVRLGPRVVIRARGRLRYASVGRPQGSTGRGGAPRARAVR